MSEDNLEGEQRERCKEAKFVDDKRAELIQRVTSVMPIADELKSKDMLHGEKYDEIRAEVTNQDKMRKLFESMKSDTVKIAFYELLEKHELPLFKELGGVCRKRKLADPESPVPRKRLNTGSNEQDNLNFNNASTSAQTPAPVYNIEYNTVNECKPVKPPAPKVKKPQAPKKEEKPTVPKVKKPLAPKKEEKPTVPKVKKPQAPKKEEKPTVPKVKKPLAPKKEQKPPVPKVKKPRAPNKNKPPVPKIKKKPPAPKKVKKRAGRK